MKSLITPFLACKTCIKAKISNTGKKTLWGHSLSIHNGLFYLTSYYHIELSIFFGWGLLEVKRDLVSRGVLISLRMYFGYGID